MGRLPPGSTPAERRWKHGRVSRIAAAVAPVDRPDEALATILGEDDADDNPPRRQAHLRKAPSSELSCRSAAPRRGGVSVKSPQMPASRAVGVGSRLLAGSAGAEKRP